ncbi:hypothetical protein WJX82_002269 [Trebouxia sp. C0006]
MDLQNSYSSVSSSGLLQLSSKLDHPLPEVRHRSLQNLFFKVTHGLSKQAAEDEPFLQNLLTWFRHDNGDACDCAMLDLLRKLAQQQGVSSKLCSLGVIAILRSLQENGSSSVQRSADTSKAASQAFGSQQEVPSYTHEQRLSPDTASSHVAPIDESAARVRCRAEWRQQSQAPAQPSLTECGWTLRAISTGAADDQHIFDLNVRLQYSDDTAVLLQALQELRSVTAADMPPEAILQRPSVLHHVLALLQPADKGSSLPKAALQFLLCFVCRIKWALGMAADPDLLPSSTGGQPPVHNVSNIAEEALHWSYPPPQSAAKPPGASLPSSAVARALAAVTAVEDNAVDILSSAHSIAVHALKLMQNPLHHAHVLLLMQELIPLLLPPAPEVLQPAGLQRFKQYFDITSEALRALQTEAVTAQAKEPGEVVKAAADCFDWTALDAASAGVLTLAGRLCPQVAPDVSSQVLPAYLANSIGALACDPFASACMPGLMPALLPYLHHLHPASANLLHHVGTAAQQAKQLTAVLDKSSQVKAGDIDAASWLHDAMLALPALGHLAEPSSQQANWRASQQGFSQWEQAQPHVISLFRQQPTARQAASKQLAAQLGLTEALQQLPDKAGNAQVAQDPFAKLLDGGITAQVTAACASRISASFSGKDVQQLKSILCMPSLNPDIRRAAADQLLSLAPDPRFAQSLSDTNVLHTLLGELIRTDNGLGCYDEFAEAKRANEAEGGQQLQKRLPGCANAQLPISCLHLLVAFVQHCSEAKALLLQGSDRLLAPLLPLIFSPLTTIRRGMAALLTHLIFASAHTAQQACGRSHTDMDSGALPLLLPRCFLHHFSFPCATVPIQRRACAVGDKDASHCAQVIKALQQQQMLQAAGGIEGLVALLQTSPGTNALPAGTLASYAAMLCRTLPAVVVPAALKKVKDAQSHEQCLQALQHLHMLCSRHNVAVAAVKGPPSLPLALTNHADAAFMFSEAQQQLSDIEVTQVTLATLTSLLQEAQLSGKPTTCSDILHAVDAPALIRLLCSATITNTEAAYSSRTAAIHLLTQLNACIRLAWDPHPSATPGSEWDSAVVGAIGGIALACLKEVVGAVPVELWSEAWQQVGGTFWLTRLSRDREASVRVAALGLLAHLASPRAPATRRMLLQGWPEAGTALLKVALQKEEPLAVRAAALRFLAVAMTMSSSEAAQEAQPNTHASHQYSRATDHPQLYDDPASPDRSSLLASATGSPHVQRPAVTTEAARSGLALVPAAHDGLVQSRGYPSLQAVPVQNQDFAAPLFLQSDFAARQYTQGIWDFGVEQLLLQGSFWEQLPDLLQGPDVTPSYMTALTAVLLQAAIADPDLSQAVQSDTPPGYANADALEALLHCYSEHAQAASSQLPEPVWPVQNARQKQQQAMLQHIAHAGAAVLAGGHVNVVLSTPPGDAGTGESVGSCLCSGLAATYLELCTDGQLVLGDAIADRACAAAPLRCLLAFSQDAKAQAISIEAPSKALQPGNGSPELLSAASESSLGVHSTSVVQPNSEADATRQQLLMALSLLKHLAHNSPAACEAIVAAGVMDTVRRMWKMALGHDGLLHEVLGLLANLFPGCPSAQKAFASSGNPSLLQRTLVLVNKPNLDLPTLEMGMTTVANLAGSAEGCLLLLRSPLLAKTEQQLHQLLQRRDGPRVAAFLEPLINLSAHAEGQKQVLRCTSAPGLLDLALTAAQLHHAAGSAKALFLLRNLALAAENKVHFVTNPRALPVLLAAAARAGHNAEAGACAASALWALVHQGEKVKASLRSLPHAQAQLQEAEAACFGSQRMQMQQKADAVDAGGDGYNTQALQALQMLLLLLEFPKDRTLRHIQYLQAVASQAIG